MVILVLEPLPKTNLTKVYFFFNENVHTQI